MSNKLRIVVKIVISFLIWALVSFIALSAYSYVSFDEVPCGGYENGMFWDGTCKIDNPYSGLAEIIDNNMILASILSFVIIPTILIYLFNFFFFKKKTKRLKN